MILDSHIYGEDSEPRAWLISKVMRISPNGVVRVTLTQDLYDQHKDYIERDSDGNIIGMWADWFSSNIEPTPIIPDDDVPQVTSVVSCSGKPQIKIGGSAKTLTVTFQDEDGAETGYVPGSWSFTIDGEDASSLLAINQVEDGKVKITFVGDDTYINKILTATFGDGDAQSSLALEILPL